MTQDNVTVTTDGSDIDKTVDSLRSAGMTVTAVHREIGMVSGTVAPTERDLLGILPGVAGVESDRVMEISPPDADVQ